MTVATIWENPCDRFEVLKAGIAAFVTLLFSFALISIRGTFNGWLLLLIAAPISFAVFWITGWGRECLRRPARIEIIEGGLLLTERYSRKVTSVQWQEITRLNVLLDDPKIRGVPSAKDGFLKTTNGRRYTICWDAAIAIRGVYIEKMGKAPENPSAMAR
jgi:hypothetical protein